jgi:hypothetical protein
MPRQLVPTSPRLRKHSKPIIVLKRFTVGDMPGIIEKNARGRKWRNSLCLNCPTDCPESG